MRYNPCKTTTWNDQVLCCLEILNHDGQFLKFLFQIYRCVSDLVIPVFIPIVRVGKCQIHFFCKNIEVECAVRRNPLTHIVEPHFTEWLSFEVKLYNWRKVVGGFRVGERELWSSNLICIRTLQWKTRHPFHQVWKTARTELISFLRHTDDNVREVTCDWNLKKFPTKFLEICRSSVLNNEELEVDSCSKLWSLGWSFQNLSFKFKVREHAYQWVHECSGREIPQEGR